MISVHVNQQTVWRKRKDPKDRERKRVGEWSMGVVRGIIECLRGPYRLWAAEQGEGSGVEERKKR